MLALRTISGPAANFLNRHSFTITHYSSRVIHSPEIKAVCFDTWPTQHEELVQVLRHQQRPRHHALLHMQVASLPQQSSAVP